MKLKKITFKNWGRHKLLTKTIDAQVVGILGPNGCGKTTVLKGVDFAFTGKTTDNLDSYVRDMGQGEAVNGSVDIEFEKNGQEGRIFRQVGKSPKRFLEWDGVKITKAKEVEEALEDIFGADRQAVSSAVFIAQGELDKFMFGTTAEREQLFMKLMLLNFMEKRAELVTRKIELLSTGLQDFSIQRDELAGQRREIELHHGTKSMLLAGMPSHSSEITELERWILNERELEKWGRELSSYGARVREKEASLTLQLGKVDSVLQVYGGEWSPTVCRGIETRKEAIVQLSKDIDSATSALKSNEKAVEDSRRLKEAELIRTTLEPVITQSSAQITALEEKVSQTKRDRLQDELRTLDARERAQKAVDDNTRQMLEASEEVSKVSAAHKPEPHPVENIHEMKDALRDAKFKLSLLQRCQETPQGTRCPVCESEVDGTLWSAEKIDSLTEGVRKVSAEIASRETANEVARKLNLACDKRAIELRAQIAQLFKEIEAAHAKIAECKHVTDSRETITELLNVMDRDRKHLAEITTKHHADTVNLGRAQAVIESFEGRIVEPLSAEKLEAERTRITEQIDDLANLNNLYSVLVTLDADLRDSQSKVEVAQAELTKAESNQGTMSATVTALLCGKEPEPRLQELKDIERERAELAGAVSEAARQVEEVKQRQDTLEHRAEKDAATRALIEQLRMLKETFTRGGLPLSYMAYQFERLVVLAQSFLADMDANFSIATAPDKPMSFTFMRVDEHSGVVMPQEKLSGGQRVRLAVAMLMAVQSLILPDVGFLVLDEPSVHLDTEGVENLKELLLDIGHRLGSTDMQVLVCDHHESLEPAFGAVIRMS
jgi:DNA repair protein SbcC/Rad50